MESISEIQDETQRVSGKWPCFWQAQVCDAILKSQGKKDAWTGLGKTLTFWMPLIFQPQGIQIVVTPQHPRQAKCRDTGKGQNEGNLH